MGRERAMYQTGELVVYGTTGVCRVEGFGSPDPMDRSGKQYYLLKPLYQDGIIYTPVEGGKVPMRPVMSAEEARALAAEVPRIQPEEHRARTIQLLTQHYQTILQSGSNRELLELTMSIYAKRCQAEQHNRRLGLVDERYGRHAERLLFGELAAALGLPYDEVPGFLFSRGTAKT